jgi:hypothetical protein
MTPPGTRLRALAARLCAPITMERLVDPAIADLQAEYEEASRTGPGWRRRENEILVRVALGAGRGRIRKTVIRGATRGGPASFTRWCLAQLIPSAWPSVDRCSLARTRLAST